MFMVAEVKWLDVSGDKMGQRGYVEIGWSWLSCEVVFVKAIGDWGRFSC